jgi:transcription initiation protein SPT3
MFSNDDIIFQFRNDPARLARLRTFLGWKSIRKQARSSDDDKSGNTELAVFEEPLLGSMILDPGDEPHSTSKIKMPAVTLPWDISSFFSEEITDAGQDEISDEVNESTLVKLHMADEKTKNMTVEEYATWSEYRHASFTWRKAKRFREWAGLGIIAENRPSDDVLDILGFLTCEMVQRLTGAALAIQHREMICQQTPADSKPSNAAAGYHGLFIPPDKSRLPVNRKHIRFALEKLQARPRRNRPFLGGLKQLPNGGLTLVSCRSFSWSLVKV